MESRISPVPEEDAVPIAGGDLERAEAEPRALDPATQDESGVPEEEEVEQILQQSETIATTPVARDKFKTVVDIQESFRVREFV